ncbi:MAG: pyridoxal phosphate-dependent aminotransferase [Clostridia bacterium]|nr:pyridoxal phosphate-dependent aminotransferase [Clostridia bacterium]
MPFYNEKAYALGSNRSIIREIFEYGKKRKSEIGTDKVYDFSLGNPSVSPPEKVIHTLKTLLSQEDQTGLHGYTSAVGDLATRKAVADYANKSCGAGLTPELIYMTCGAAASLTISLKAVLKSGEECVVFAPFFTEYKVFVENANANLVVSLPEDNTLQIDIEDFESRITEKTRAVIVNSPNNPSGVVYREDKIIALCDILRKKSKEYGSVIYLITDEPYRELVYGDVKVPYLTKYYDDVIVCYSYSKALSLPGERIGYIAVSPKTKDAKEVYDAICGAGRSLGYVCAPSLFQKLIATCADAKVDVSVYRKNRDILYDNLVAMGYDCVRPDGAFYLFVKAFEKDAVAFCEKAKKYELLLVPCDNFGVNGYVRIAYCVDEKTIINSLPAFRRLREEYLK